MNELFIQIAQAAFSNPFSDERAATDRQIMGADPNHPWQEIIDPLLRKLNAALRDAQEAGTLCVDRHAGPDAEAMAVSILFSVFHHYALQFDELIKQQIDEGDESCRAPFALQCMNDLVGYGFEREDACRYVGMFYQIRRAFFFISSALVGQSPCMKRLRAQLWNNIFTYDIAWYERSLWNRMEDFSTLLLGETGTGKGAAAAAIGRSGFIPFNPATQKFEESFTSAFVSINLSQYSESLIESELFGHRKGAFTGAIDRHDGIFARCSPHGAIFLDEIGDVSVPIQIKLLQILQQRTFTPVGSHHQKRFEGRVIAATNKSLDDLRREGHFRDDFYYRLCSDLIIVPPLNERIRETPEELELLATHIIERMCGTDATPSILERLHTALPANYPWPGNVRELEQAIRRIILTGTYHGDTAATNAETTTFAQLFTRGQLTAKELIAKYCQTLYQTTGNYGQVARQTGLDWRTVKKYVGEGDE